jgi:hypothetical protein
MSLMLSLMLAASFDGEAALRHAASLAALGPHPWGSPRARVAAEYVASQFREAGLEEVRLQEFESHGVRGTNVVGVLRAPGPDLVVVGAHHDTAPEAPGAYDDGGGVGVLIETARVLAKTPKRARTLVFVSWDGEEAWSTGKTTTSGSRAYIKSLGAQSRDLVAAYAIEMCGWKGGTPVLHPIAYADPRSPGASVIAPGWVMEAALSGASGAGAPLRVGDPLLSWLYQPAVRTFKVGLYGDDLSFLQAGLPAVFSADSSFTAYYPWYHKPDDTADKLDAASLARMGRSVVGVVEGLSRATRGPSGDGTWFAVGSHVFRGTALALLLSLAVVPGLVIAFRSGGSALYLRLAQAVFAALLFWRHPVPAVWVLVLPALLSTAPGPRWVAAAVGLLPALTLAGLGAAAFARGYVRGSWMSLWEVGLLLVALALAAVPVARTRGVKGGGRTRGARGGRKKPGLRRH